MRQSLLVRGRIDLGVATLSKGVSSAQSIPQKDEYPRGSGFLGRMSVLGNSWVMFSGRSFASRTCCLSLGVSDEMRHMSCPSTGQNWPLQMFLHFLFFQASGREWSGLIWFWFKKLRCLLWRDWSKYLSYSEPFLKTGVGEDGWQINDQNPDFMMDEIVW